MYPQLNPVHFNLSTTAFHINYRLAGSIPKAAQLALRAKRQVAVENMQRRLPVQSHPYYEEAYRLEAAALGDLTEDLLETALHGVNSGPKHLDHPAIRGTILNAWRFLERENTVDLHALCTMSNHVHVVVAAPPGRDLIDLGRLMQRHKNYTALTSNKLLGRRGKPFWAPNYFDRTIRAGSWLTVMWYVINNPVKARLVRQWQDWPGTYVSPRFIDHFL